MDGLRPKNNEFVEGGLENWALINQTNTGNDSDDKRMKRKRIVLKNIVLSKVREGLFFYITHKSCRVTNCSPHPDGNRRWAQ